MASEPKYESAEIEYVQTPGTGKQNRGISIRALAKKWNMPQGTIATRSQSQKWKQKRDDYWRAVGQATKSKGVERHSGNADAIKSQIETNIATISALVTGCLDTINSHKRTDVQQFATSKLVFETLKCCKIATETINNIDEMVNEIYGIGNDSDGLASEDIAALVRLAISSDSGSPIPRSEFN